MRHVGIIGGTFDPPHIGHLLMAEEARLRVNLDEVWWLPNRIPPHKKQPSQTSEKDRLALTERMVSLHEHYQLSTVELERDGRSYTYDTMKQLCERYSDTRFYFIIGGDMIDDLPNWYRIDDLLELVTFIGIDRPGYRNVPPYDEWMIHLEGALVDVSSSSIRNQIKEGSLNQFLLTKDVFDYIKEYRLYE
ncbi:nicotinate-nucleotide adenylyltransferase [Texcoconibacillus texcoconensis]|uniref:Probable nicotinate-nucleotide adenylyltransferase n=1 Tax=Texcoconibacillus texcoconensis TaxID=1095777 RepID=A0A840QRJ5_9BACI|nr:nicotinate-nucleotide adenylyltransferase [Texcoconibacillus texcoconensis]MBB5173970.1 nicotinate-nucleotide adenylyltransferase [Texcoconibacillus texcoconensis]